MFPFAAISLILPFVFAMGSVGFMVQTVFQSLFPVAEKPKLGLALTVLSSMADILLNALFIIVFGWGVVGAAVSSIIGQILGSVIPILYFLRRGDSLLRSC